MLKVRITFVDNTEGNKELQDFIKNLERDNTILNKSQIYKGRGSSMYSNIYLDLEKKEKKTLVEG